MLCSPALPGSRSPCTYTRTHAHAPPPHAREQSITIVNMIKLYGKAIRVNKSSSDKNTNEVGANLFVGNLDPEVDEKVRACVCGCARMPCVCAHMCANV